MQTRLYQDRVHQTALVRQKLDGDASTDGLLTWAAAIGASALSGAGATLSSALGRCDAPVCTTMKQFGYEPSTSNFISSEDGGGVSIQLENNGIRKVVEGLAAESIYRKGGSESSTCTKSYRFEVTEDSDGAYHGERVQVEKCSPTLSVTDAIDQVWDQPESCRAFEHRRGDPLPSECSNRDAIDAQNVLKAAAFADVIDPTLLEESTLQINGITTRKKLDRKKDPRVRSSGAVDYTYRYRNLKEMGTMEFRELETNENILDEELQVGPGVYFDEINIHLDGGRDSTTIGQAIFVKCLSDKADFTTTGWLLGELGDKESDGFGMFHAQPHFLNEPNDDCFFIHTYLKSKDPQDVLDPSTTAVQFNPDRGVYDDLDSLYRYRRMTHIQGGDTVHLEKGDVYVGAVSLMKIHNPTIPDDTEEFVYYSENPEGV